MRGAALRTINALHTGLLIDDRWWPPTCAAKRATDYLRNTIQLDYYRINTAAATNDNAADDRGGRKHDRSQTAAFARRHVVHHFQLAYVISRAKPSVQRSLC